MKFESEIGSDVDWPEDFEGENGNYNNTCTSCGYEFIGHKRRQECKVCASRVSLSAPVKELEGTFPVVLYFGNDKDREEFIKVVKEAKPNLVAKKL